MTPATIKVLLSHLVRIPLGIGCRLQTHPFGCSATPFYMYNIIIALFYSTVKDSRQSSYKYQTKQLHFKISLINCHILYYFNSITCITSVQYIISLRVFKEGGYMVSFTYVPSHYIIYPVFLLHQNISQTFSALILTIWMMPSFLPDLVFLCNASDIRMLPYHMIPEPILQEDF